jgi:CsoR family transcriptional regulator, copper-sensing transcriptional repressor
VSGVRIPPSPLLLSVIADFSAIKLYYRIQGKRSALVDAIPAKEKRLVGGDHTPPHEHSEHSHTHHGHVHSEESLRAIVNRLSRIEGHIRGIKTMVQDGRDCPDVLVQIAAVRGALDRVARAILDEHLTECVLRAAKEGNIEAEIEELRIALDRFLP